MKITILKTVLCLSFVFFTGSARAFVFSDVPAFGQRAAQFIQTAQHYVKSASHYAQFMGYVQEFNQYSRRAAFRRRYGQQRGRAQRDGLRQGL